MEDAPDFTHRPAGGQGGKDLVPVTKERRAVAGMAVGLGTGGVFLKKLVEGFFRHVALPRAGIGKKQEAFAKLSRQMHASYDKLYLFAGSMSIG